MSVTVTKLGAMRCASVKRRASGAMPLTGFNGFCGETSHQTRSSRSKRLAWTDK